MKYQFRGQSREGLLSEEAVLNEILRRDSAIMRAGTEDLREYAVIDVARVVTDRRSAEDLLEAHRQVDGRLAEGLGEAAYAGIDPDTAQALESLRSLVKAYVVNIFADEALSSRYGGGENAATILVPHEVGTVVNDALASNPQVAQAETV